MQQHLMPIFNRLPIAFTYGKGSWLYDEHNQAYLDTFGGLAVAVLGHAHEEINQALQKQAKLVWHTSNAFEIPLQAKLAEKICQLTQLDRAFFCNSGAEANETAIKLARLYAHQKNISNPNIIVTHKGYHGRSIATLSASGNRIMQQGFEPLVADFIHVPFNDIAAIKELSETNPNIVGILIEPIQGNGGIIIPNEHYLISLREICNQKGWLLMLDEIQTGLFRTGKFCNYQHFNILPDIITIAKGLANGLPIGVCVAKEAIANLFKPGTHGSTFGGNPLVSSVALKVLEVMEKLEAYKNAEDVGNYLLAGLKQTLNAHELVQDIRGQGLMIGIELKIPCKELSTIALTENLLINITQEKVIRLLPSLLFSKDEADLLIQKLTNTINHFSSQHIQVA